MVGYLIAKDELSDRQLAAYESIQITDTQTIQEAAARGGFREADDPRVRRQRAIMEVQDALRAVAIRPNVINAEVIAPDGIVIAASSRRALGQSRVDDPHIRAALDRGSSVAQRGDDEGDENNFHFVSPIQIGPRRLALDTTYDHATFDARLESVRTALIVTSLLTLLLGGAVFYIVGGRALVRSHRFALQRATLDGLTGLFNQRAFADDLERIVRTSEELGEPLCLALVSVDNFSEVNDRRGREKGDALLLRVAADLQKQRPADRVYRTADDEFAILLAQADARTSRTLVGRIAGALRADGLRVSLGASNLREGTPPDVLRSEANAALAESKRRGGNMYSHFDDLRGEIVVSSADQLDAVRQMIKDGGITTAFQPIWDLKERKLLGMEALTRPDPAYGLSGPAEAFDIAEQIGQVRALDAVCLRSALSAARDLPEGALLFVNVSPQTLDIGIADEGWLQAESRKRGLAAERIVVEVTERYGGRTATVVKHLEALKAQGFKIALDDVGAGNSGLEILGAVQADFVKIDRGVVTAAPHDLNARAVLMAIATYAFQTGSFVIAEGIEDGETLAFLEQIDAKAIRAALVVQGGQGYGLGRPSPDIPSEPGWPQSG